MSKTQNVKIRIYGVNCKGVLYNVNPDIVYLLVYYLQTMYIYKIREKMVSGMKEWTIQEITEKELSSILTSGRLSCENLT